MSFLIYRPGPPLNEFVEYFWLIDGGQVARLERILPSGTIELVVNLKTDEIAIHDPNQPGSFKNFSGAVFSGTYDRPFICNAVQHESIMGVHFRAGGASPFLDVESKEVTNAHVNLFDLWGQSGPELRERLCLASTLQERFDILNTTLRSRLLKYKQSKFQTRIALEMVEMMRHKASVRDASQEFGFSQRRFIQTFNLFVGLSPKLYARILRFQKARLFSEKCEMPGWAEVAVSCGYFDQSHLIRDFKQFSGSTPRIYSEHLQNKDTLFKDNHVPLS